MALQHPNPSEAVVQVVQSTLSRFAEQPERSMNALGGSAPAELSMEAPHEVYNLGLDQLDDAADLEVATSTGWRYLLRQPSGTVASAQTAIGAGGEPVFALFNSGPFVGATEQALAQADQLGGGPDDATLEPRLLQVPALHALALWLHGPGEADDIILPLDPSPPTIDGSRQYSVKEYLDALRLAAETVARVGRDDQTAG